MSNTYKYRPRKADRILERKLKCKGAVLIEGALPYRCQFIRKQR